MYSGDSSMIVLVATALAVGLAAAVFLLLSPYLSGSRRAQRRIEVASESRSKRVAVKTQTDNSGNRRKSVADTLKEVEERRQSKARPSLRAKLRQAGFDVDNNAFYMASACSGVFVTLIMMVTVNSSILTSTLCGFVGAFGLPYWVLNKLIKRRQNKFLEEFANAIDVIVRGVKSGLPLNECLAIVSREAAEPVAGEFREVVEQQRVGVPLAEAFDRMMLNMPLAEVRFFAIVIGISQTAGGNLSEALSNLSGVLRDRKKLQGKVASMSAEAKSSAAVLGALPFGVTAIVYMTTPAYISTLWTTTSGQLLLACAGVWMGCGLLVMKKMINFKY